MTRKPVCDPDVQWWTRAEAAHWLRLSIDTIDRRIQMITTPEDKRLCTTKIRAMKVGARVLLLSADVLAILPNMRKPTESQTVIQNKPLHIPRAPSPATWSAANAALTSFLQVHPTASKEDIAKAASEYPEPF